MWVFLFSFQAYQLSVFVTCVKASYMFNKANYLVNYIHEGILLTFITGVLGQIGLSRPTENQVFYIRLVSMLDVPFSAFVLLYR